MIHGSPHEPRVVNATVGPRRPLNRRSLAGRRIPMPRLPEVVMVSVEGVFNA